MCYSLLLLFVFGVLCLFSVATLSFAMSKKKRRHFMLRHVFGVFFPSLSYAAVIGVVSIVINVVFFVEDG